MRLSRSRNSKGFTIVELLLAVTFFSFILLFVAAAFIQINRQFVKGRITREIQHDGRLVIEDITRALRSSSAANYIEVDTATQKRICFGNTRYAWTTLADQQATPNTAEDYSSSSEDINIVKLNDYNGSNCDSPVDKAESFEFASSTSSVQYFDVEQNYSGLSGLYRVTLVLSTRQAEIIGSLAGSDFQANCEGLNSGGSVGTEYCSFVNFRTVVNVR